MRVDHKSRWLLVTLLAASVLYGLVVDRQLDLNGDSPRYVMLARSLIRGTGYISDFGIRDRPETQYPYGYPLLLGPLVAAFGPSNYLSFKLLSVTCMILAVWGAWFWLRRWIPRDEAFLAAVACALSAQFQFYSVATLTEAPFLAASFFCLGSMEQLTRRVPPKPGDWVLFLITLSIAFHLRVAGIGLLLASCVTLLIRGRPKMCLVSSVLGISVCLPWLIRLARLGSAYQTEFEEVTPGIVSFAKRIAYNGAADVAKALPDLFFFPFFSRILPYEPLFFVKAAVGLAILGVMAWGLWKHFSPYLWINGFKPRQIRMRVSASEVYLAVYMAICLSWTTHGDRFLLPIMPVLIYLLIKGFGRHGKELILMLVVANLFGCTIRIIHAWENSRPSEEAGFLEAAAWLQKNADPSQRVMSRFPTWIAAVNGQRGLRWESSPDPDLHRQALLQNRIRWIILDHNRLFRDTAAQLMTPLIQKYPSEFVLRFESSQKPSTRVYEFTSDQR